MHIFLLSHPACGLKTSLSGMTHTLAILSVSWKPGTPRLTTDSNVFLFSILLFFHCAWSLMTPSYRRHEKLTRSCMNVEPASTTLVQHSNNASLLSHAFWVRSWHRLYRASTLQVLIAPVLHEHSVLSTLYEPSSYPMLGGGGGIIQFTGGGGGLEFFWNK